MVRFLNGSKQVIVLTFHGRQNCYMQKFNEIRNKPILDGNYCFLFLQYSLLFNLLESFLDDSWICKFSTTVAIEGAASSPPGEPVVTLYFIHVSMRYRSV